MRVVVLGTGQMGSAIIRNVVEAPELTLVGVVAKRPDRAGHDAGIVAGLGEPLGVAVDNDLEAVLARLRPDAAVHATCSTLADATAEIDTCLEHGVSVVSIAEEMVWPAAYSPDWARRVHDLGVARGATVLGTGVNPGFVMDLLAVTLTNVCTEVESILVRRSNDLSPYGPTVLRTQGVGLGPDAFRAGLESGEVVGHVGFPASIAMIAAALGWEIDRVEETREPIMSEVARRTPFIEIAPGQTAGCRHTAVGYRAGAPVITLVHPQQVQPEAEGSETEDVIEINGAPSLRWVSRPEVPGGVATAALGTGYVTRVVEAEPGLTSMIEHPPARRPTRGVAAGQLAAGTLVEVGRVVLGPGERAPNVPADTRQVPLEMRSHGTLVEPASVGREATIVTAAGRRLTGVLIAAVVAPPHSFGPPVPELVAVGEELRSLLTGREDEPGR